MLARAKGSTFARRMVGEGPETGTGAGIGESPRYVGASRRANGDCKAGSPGACMEGPDSCLLSEGNRQTSLLAVLGGLLDVL